MEKSWKWMDSKECWSYRDTDDGVLIKSIWKHFNWLKYTKFDVGTPMRESLVTQIRGVGMLMCQKLEVWERRSRPFPVTLNTFYHKLEENFQTW